MSRWDRIKLILRCFFAIQWERNKQGYHWYVRFPLFIVEVKKSWMDPVFQYPVTSRSIGVWPNFPLKDGGFIYRWRKDWHQ